MTDDVSALRNALQARVESCWDRLEDVVSELRAVHEVEGDRILEAVRMTLAAEEPAAVDAT